MRLLISIVTSLLTLVGCDPRHTTTTLTLSFADGIQVNSTQARIDQGHARFECLQSSSGYCYYMVFTEACAGTGPKQYAGAGTCTTRPVHRFTLATGETREFTDLPAGARHCVNHEAMPVAPGCNPA